MKHGISLTLKILIGFVAVTTSLIVFLFYNNVYGMKVVREEVSKSNYDLLQSHGKQMDNELKEAMLYLLRLTTNDSFFPDLIALSILPVDSSDYFFAKQRLMKTFSDHLDIYRNVDTFFTYSIRTNDLIMTARNIVETEKTDRFLREQLGDLNSVSFNRWQPVKQGNERYLYRVEQATPDLFVGVLINVKTMLVPLEDVRFGENGRATLLTQDGEPVNDNAITPEQRDVVKEAMREHPQRDGSFRLNYKGIRYLFIEYTFQEANVRLAAFMPEKDLLRQLTYFQLTIYMIPIAGLLVLAVYFLFLKRVLQKPMTDLINGMRRIIRGDFEFRLSDGSSLEFSFLIEMFNKMVTQIRHLKVNVYEETLKKQEAEFKHLQAQINPHFYLNSLNIINSLSILEENELVQKMTQHLADYFRFIMRSHQESITLAEEMAHIRNYLEIQKLRFPEKLTYAITIPAEMEQTRVLPLTVQPFVENAIIHGMDIETEVFHVDIHVQLSADCPGCFEVRIVDNGIGFPATLLTELQNGEYANGGGLKHLGIWNVHQRLRMKYGNDVGISFANTFTQGAEVVLTIPYGAQK